MRIVICIVLLLSLSSCGVLSPVKVKPVSHYTIGATSSLSATTSTGAVSENKTLLLQTMLSNPGYQTSNMIYVSRPHQLESFAYHQWVAPPSQLILPVIMRSLQNKKHFHAVVMTPSTNVSDFVLATRLLYLNESLVNSKRPVVSCAIDVALINVSSGRVIRERVFSAQRPTRSDAYSYAYNANQMVGQLAVKIADFATQQA